MTVWTEIPPGVSSWSELGNPGGSSRIPYVPYASPLPLGHVIFGQNTPELKGGLLIGGEGDSGEGVLLGSSGNPAWADMMPSRAGSPVQLQLYSRGWAGEANSVIGTNQLVISYGTIPSDRLSELLIGMPIGFGGKLYRIGSVTDGSHLTVTSLAGGAVVFADSNAHTFKIAYQVSEGICNTNGTAVTRVSGDPFHGGSMDTWKVIINGTQYTINAVASGDALTLSASAGIQNNVSYKEITVDTAYYYSLLRLQGVLGGKEDNLSVYLNINGQVRIDTQNSNLPEFPDLVFGTGLDPSLPGSVSYNTRKQHLRISPTGEVQAGPNFIDSQADSDLAVQLYTMGIAELPKLASYRYSATAHTGGGTARLTLARFGASFANTNRSLDIIANNNFFGPSLQGRLGNGTPVQISLQPEGGDLQLAAAAGKIGFFAATPVVKGTVTGAKGGNAALTSLLSLLASMGLLTDSST